MKTARKTRQHDTTDIIASIAALKQQRATIDQQYETATTNLAAEQAAGQHAQQLREELRPAALAQGEPAARKAYAEATTSFRTHADNIFELSALLEQLGAEGRRIDHDLRNAAQAYARALNRGDADEAIAATRQIDAAVATILAAWRQLETVRLRQLQRAANANLPDAEMGRYHDFRIHRRVLSWGLIELGVISRPASHYGQGLTLEQAERAVQLGESAEAAPTEPTAVIDAALAEAERADATTH